MDFQLILDDADALRARTERLVAQAWRDAAAILTPAEIEECRQEAAALTPAELAALLADLAC